MIRQLKPIPTEAYFPYCMLPKEQCEKFFGKQKQQPHQHVLPQQQRIMDSTAKHLYMQGGVGGGKSEAFAAKCVKLCIEIPRNQGIVGRLNFGELFDSSWRKVLDCIQRLVDAEYIPEPQYSIKEKGNYTLITFHTGSELKAVHGKNWRQALGSDKGLYWIDDALEVPREFFTGINVTAGLMSRLRLPHVVFDKRTYDEVTRPHGSLHGMVSSNPPPYGHWLHTLYGDKPGFYDTDYGTVEWIRGETTDNPFTGASYAKNIIATQVKMGANEGTIRRVVFGESIPAYKGIPVFPQFKRSKHIAPLKFNPDLPLICGWDFGFRHPAIVYSHIYRCQYGTNHLLTLSEVGDAFGVEVHELYKEYHLPHMNRLYKDAKLVRHAGDRSGYRASSSNKDKRGDMKILIFEYHLPFRWRYIDVVPSLQYMRGLLKPDKPCKCGMELILISEKCPMLAAGLEGGYHYQEKNQSEKPYEDRFFADVVCAWRYTAENYVKRGVDYQDEKLLRQQRAQQIHAERIQQALRTPYGWLDLPQAEPAQVDVS